MSTCDDIINKLNTIEDKVDNINIALSTQINDVSLLLTSLIDGVENNDSKIYEHIQQNYIALYNINESIKKSFEVTKANQTYIKDSIYPNLLVGSNSIKFNNMHNVLKQINVAILGGSNGSNN